MDEDYFQAALDARIDDDSARLLFSEWLAECGDPRADGYRWMAVNEKHPHGSNFTWDWWNADSHNDDSIRLPNALWQLLLPPPNEAYVRCKEFATRRDAENELCRALVEWLPTP